MTDTQEDNLARAKEQGQAQFDSIVEMVEALNMAIDEDEGESHRDAAERAINEDALSVEVRSGWVSTASQMNKFEPEEYRILLCTGGPACQIRGTLSEHGEPETARLEVQDWFTPWTKFWPKRGDDPNSKGDAEEILLAYARCFYFGE